MPLDSANEKQLNAHTDGRIWALAWPLILSNLTQPLLGLVDTALLGHLPSQQYLGASAVGASIISLLFWGFGFLRMGTTSLVSRALGGGRRHRAYRYFGQHFSIAVVIAVLLLLLAPLLLPAAVAAMQASADVSALAHSYAQIRLYAAPAALVNYVLIGWFIAAQNTRLPLYTLIVTNAVNVVLDLLFINLFDWRSDGAAWASVASEYLGLGLGVYFFVRYWPLKCSLNWRSLLPRAELIAVNRHLFIRTMALLFTLLFFTAQGARLGDNLLAANAILLQLVHLVSYGLDGLAHATESLAGAAKGAANGVQQRRILRRVLLWGGWIAVAISGVFWLAQAPISALFSDLQSVLETLHDFYFWAVVLPLVSVGAYIYDGFFIGIGHTKTMRNTLLFSVFMVFLPVWWATLSWGNHGLWFAFCLFNLARSLTLGWCSRTYIRAINNG